MVGLYSWHGLLKVQLWLLMIRITESHIVHDQYSFSYYSVCPEHNYRPTVELIIYSDGLIDSILHRTNKLQLLGFGCHCVEYIPYIASFWIFISHGCKCMVGTYIIRL